MKKSLSGPTVFALSFCVLGKVASIAHAENLVEMQRYLRKSTSFTSRKAERGIPLEEARIAEFTVGK